jgi:hypothetical protein
VSLLEGHEPDEDERRFGIDQPRVPRTGMRTGGDGMVADWAD